VPTHIYTYNIHSRPIQRSSLAAIHLVESLVSDDVAVSLFVSKLHQVRGNVSFVEDTVPRQGSYGEKNQSNQRRGGLVPLRLRGSCRSFTNQRSPRTVHPLSIMNQQ
jgi:hypothetical protein